VHRAATQALSAAPPSPAAARTSGSSAPEASPPLTGIAGFLFLLDQLLCALMGRAFAAALTERIAAALQAVRLAAEARAQAVAIAAAPLGAVPDGERERPAAAAAPENSEGETATTVVSGKRRDHRAAMKPAPLVSRRAEPGAACRRDRRDRRSPGRNTGSRLRKPPRDAPFAIPATPPPRFFLTAELPSRSHAHVVAT
jgi:hypothetical protein